MKYLIEEKDLINLVRDSLKLTALEGDGVDNWTWYGEGFKNYIEEVALSYGKDLKEEENEDYSFQELAELITKSDYEEFSIGKFMPIG
jgi:hypothetical protein